MIRDALAAKIAHAVQSLHEAGKLPTANLGPIEIADTKQPEHGDYACNLAMIGAKAAGMNPRALGELLAGELASDSDLSSVEVAGPGFINLRLTPEFQSSFIAKISSTTSLHPQPNPATPSLRINVEFVSVNPNGPITIGSGRGAAYGSTLCNVLTAAGHTVHREYYINDGVNSEQMRLFAESVRYFIALRIFAEWADSSTQDIRDEDMSLIRAFAIQRGSAANLDRIFDEWAEFLNLNHREQIVAKLARVGLNNIKHFEGYEGERTQQLRVYLGSAYRTGSFVDPIPAFPEGGYKGDYVAENAKRLVDTRSELERFDWALPIILDPDGIAEFQNRAQSAMLASQREALSAFGVEFDTWFSEQSLHDSGLVADEVEALEATGVADTAPHRFKLKLAKGGKIEDVEIETQATDEEDTSKGEGSDDTLWLRSTKFGDDMDRVLRRRDGRLTYIASDVAYHKDKFNRPANADKLITVLGPDHHGYIGRLTAVVAAMLKAETKGRDSSDLSDTSVPSVSSVPLSETDAKLYTSPKERDACRAALAEAKNKLEVQIFQLVRFLKDGKPAPMRKRDGNIYALIDLINEIGERMRPEGTQEEKQQAGTDVARFFYLMRSHDTTFDFDLNLAETKSDENPVFYVQYAHARICSILAKATQERGLQPASGPQVSACSLEHPQELALLRKVCDLPVEISRCANDYGVHRLVTYSIELARAFHSFYNDCRVIDPENPEQTASRLRLCEVTQTALRASFDLLGVSAPEKM